MFQFSSFLKLNILIKLFYYRVQHKDELLLQEDQLLQSHQLFNIFFETLLFYDTRYRYIQIKSYKLNHRDVAILQM